MGNVFMVAYFFIWNQCTHDKLSLFLIKGSNKAPKAIYYFDKKLIVPV